MTDVRLTATNPEDSSVVPVACNSRGELLVTEPVIEQIPNDLTVQGELRVDDPDDETHYVSLASVGNVHVQRMNQDEGSGSVRLGRSYDAISVFPFGGNAAFNVFWDGRMSSRNVLLLLEASNPDHYVTTTRDGESVKEYKGPTLDVGEELKFLRAQVQALMERLKMTPEGGWPVWDGSE